MKRTQMLGACLMLGMMSGTAFATSRLIILADMGNEPDEEPRAGGPGRPHANLVRRLPLAAWKDPPKGVPPMQASR